MGPLGFNQSQRFNLAESGPGLVPNRRGESIGHRLSYSTNFETPNFGHHIAGQAGMAPWGVAPAAVDDHQGFPAPQTMFSFGRPDMHSLNPHMNNNHMNSLLSGSGNLTNSMMPSFGSLMNTSSFPYTTTMPYSTTTPYSTTMPYSTTLPYGPSMPSPYSQSYLNKAPSHVPVVPPLFNQQHSNNTSSML